MGGIKFIGTEPLVEGLAQGFVGHDGIRRGQACHIKGFRRCLEGDAYLGSFFAHRCKACMAMTKEGKIAVDFVAYYDDAVLLSKAR